MQKEGDGNEVKDSIADFGMYVSESPFKPCDAVKEPVKREWHDEHGDGQRTRHRRHRLASAARGRERRTGGTFVRAAHRPVGLDALKLQLPFLRANRLCLWILSDQPIVLIDQSGTLGKSNQHPAKVE